MTPMPNVQKASRFRYVVLALLCMLAMITYMDRAANGNARDDIMRDINTHQDEGRKYDKNDFYWVLMAFQLAYAIFEIPSGWLGDTQGTRKTLLRIVLWWTGFVFLWGFVGMEVGPLFIGFTALLLIQFFFGVGEAGAFPNIAKSLYNWFPASDRGFAKSLVWMSARFMGGMTPFVWVLLTAKEFGGLEWREALWLFAGIAALWCLAFALLFTNRPNEHRMVNSAELARIDTGRQEHTAHGGLPWGKLLRSRNLWAVCMMYVVTNFCWYFLMYNHPGAMRKAFPEWGTTGSGKLLLALLSGAPLIIGMAGCLLGGVLSDRYIRRTGDRVWGRRRYGMIGYGMAGACYVLAIVGILSAPGNLWAFAIPLIFMGFFNDLILAPAWAVCQDIGRQYAATVSGAMNMVGNLVGSVTGIFVTGRILKHYTENAGQPNESINDMGYVLCFAIYASVYMVGVILWLFIDASKPIVYETHEK